MSDYYNSGTQIPDDEQTLNEIRQLMSSLPSLARRLNKVAGLKPPGDAQLYHATAGALMGAAGSIYLLVNERGKT